MNIHNKKTKKVISITIAVLLILAMVVPTFISLFM